MSRIIEVVVTPKGETSIQTKGFAGSDCLNASRFLEDALGTKATDQPTAEMYQSSEAQQQVNQ